MPQFSLSWLRSVIAPRPVTNQILSERLPLQEGERLSSDLANMATQFWFANRLQDGPPEWSCFFPEKHPELLANLVLYERIDGSRYRTRLVGDAVVDHLPVNPVGKYLDEVIPEERFRDVSMRLDRALTDGLPNYVEKAKVWRHSGSIFDYNALSMPFLSRETGAERVLCVLEFKFQELEL